MYCEEWFHQTIRRNVDAGATDILQAVYSDIEIPGGGEQNGAKISCRLVSLLHYKLLDPAGHWLALD